MRQPKTRHDADCSIYDSLFKVCTCGFRHDQIGRYEAEPWIYPEVDVEREAESQRVLSAYYEEKERSGNEHGLSPTRIARNRAAFDNGQCVSLQEFLRGLSEEAARWQTADRLIEVVSNECWRTFHRDAERNFCVGFQSGDCTRTARGKTASEALEKALNLIKELEQEVT